MKRILSLLLAAFFLSPLLASPALAGVRFVRHGARDDKQNQLITYWVTAPEPTPPGLPLVIYLHGSGERGEGALLTSLPLFLKEGSILNPGAVILVPQMPSNFGQWISLQNSLEKMIDRTAAEYQTDESRIALVGFSMGAIGCYDLANLWRGKFCRVLAVSGRVNDDVEPDAFATVELRTMVGTRDTNMPPQSAMDFAQLVEDAGYCSEAVQLDSTHGRMPNKVFMSANMLDWLWLELAPEVTPVPTVTPKPTPTPKPTATPKPTDAPPGAVTPEPAPEEIYRTLKKGMSGKDVQALKKAMYWLGYFNTINLSEDFNSVTVERVKLLQKNNGLPQTGEADPALQALVFSGQAVKTKTAPKPSSTPKPGKK